jgi:hypothetical protein
VLEAVSSAALAVPVIAGRQTKERRILRKGTRWASIGNPSLCMDDLCPSFQKRMAYRFFQLQKPQAVTAPAVNRLRAA